VSGFAAVSDILWRERELLDVLLFKLEQERLLLQAGSAEWVPRASREIELVLEQLRLTELGRAVEVEALAAELKLSPGTTLVHLTAAAPSPWGELFAAHRAAFLSLRRRIADVAAANRAALQAAHDDTLRRLEALGADESGEDDAPLRAIG
jgi:FlgN protein